MNYQIKHLLVTGAAGFIGSNFVRYMMEHYPEITVISLDKLTYAGNKAHLAFAEQSKNHHFIHGDILDETLIATILREYEVDTVAHFAAESHVDSSIKNPSIFLTTNILGTFNLLESARKYWLTEQKWDKHRCRFHHVSTDEVYGSLNEHDPAFNEQNSYKPNSPYSASKASADHIVRAYFKTYGLPVITSNCSNNYGPNQHKEKLIPKIITACLHNQPITIYGNGTHVRDWLFVDDHCDAIDLIIRKGTVGDSYNIGGNNELDNLSLIKTICRIMDELIPMSKPYESLIVFMADRGHDKRYAIDNSKIINDLQWVPKSDHLAKLTETIQHYINLEQAALKLVPA